MEDEDSQKALLSKKEAKKAAAARKRTQQRFEGLLTVGSGGEETPEHVVRKSKPKERTKTADDSLSRSKRTPNLKKRSKSEENLLQTNRGDDESHQESSKHSLEISKSTKLANSQRKKKKKRPAVQESQEKGTSNDAYERTSLQNNETYTDEYTMNDVTEIEQDSSKHSMRKKKRRKPKDSTTDKIYKALEKKRHDDGLLLCIIIHKADQLQPDSRLQHPLIQVHLVHMDTGQYIKKTDSARNVTSVFENKNENIDYILPVMSQPFDFKRKRSFTPMWNEMILYNEVYSYFLQREPDDPPVIVFFELIDFVLMNTKSTEISKSQKGWHRIAWAFLKLVSPSGATNTDKKARLQLFKPYPNARLQPIDSAGIEVYQWWKTKPRLTYPSSLTVTVKGVQPPTDLSPRARSMYPTQQERGSKTFEELNSMLQTKQSSFDMELPMWTKMPGQVNRIPNEMKLILPTGKKGCSVVRFSNEGRYIACACSTNDGHPIKLFEFPSGQFLCTFSNHFGIIYDLCWSANDKELLSASADSTVRLWDTKRFDSTCIKLFPHPTFVYSAKYHPVQSTIIVTGCYDNYLRVWSKISDTEHAQLLRELSGHTSFINAITFLQDGEVFFSGDSLGTILQWACHVDKRKKKSTILSNVDRWKMTRIIELPEIKSTVINTLAVHPNQMKVLVHTRDSVIRMLDLRSYGILKTYLGGFNLKEHIHACFSNCGSFIFCGMENGHVNVWDTETGDLLSSYNQLNYNRSICDIHFHKQDNFIAFCCYGDGGQPVQIFQYNPQVNLSKSSPIETTIQKSKRLEEAEENLNHTTMQFESFQETKKDNEQHKQERINQLEKRLQNVFLSDGKTLSETKHNTMKQAHQTMLSTWGSDFSKTNTQHTGFPSTFQPPPSPHAHQHLGASGRFQTMSPATFSRSGSIDMYLDETKKNKEVHSPNRPVFTFNRTSNEPAKENRIPTKIVRAIYEYRPRRADELMLYPNDRIKVLFEDSEEWWMGQSEDGHQGYFPASYVQEETDPGLTDAEHSAVVDKYGNIKFLATNDVTPTKSSSKKSRKKRPTATFQGDDETNC